MFIFTLEGGVFMPKYTKRNDGRYVASITINGKKKYIYARSQKELDIKLTETKSLCYKGISLSNETMTIKKLSDMWFDLIQKKILQLLKKGIAVYLITIYVLNLDTYH